MRTIKTYANLCMVWIAMCCSYASFAQKSPDVMKNEKAIKQVYAAYQKKDWHMLELVFADGFTFTSPNGDDHINLKKYKEKCWPNCENIKRVDFEKIIIDGDDGYVTYNGWTNSGELFRNTEYYKFKDGKIISIECFFGPGKKFPNNNE